MRTAGHAQNKQGRWQRYRCTCGHVSEVADTLGAWRKNADPDLPEGIQELVEQGLELDATI
jgi:hypothetical protein